MITWSQKLSFWEIGSIRSCVLQQGMEWSPWPVNKSQNYKLNKTCFLLMSSVFSLISLTFHKTFKKVLSHFLEWFCLTLHMNFILRKGKRKSQNRYNLSSSFPLINGQTEQTELFPQPSNCHLLCDSHCWLQTRLVKLYLISESIIRFPFFLG